MKYATVRYARNITDVDDKINNEAIETGEPIQALADRYAAEYRQDVAALGVAEATSNRARPNTSSRSSR